MEHASTFLADLAIVLVVAAATSVVFRLLKQPVVLGYLLAGLIVGPHIPVPLFADAERVRALAEFGVVLVMFSVGLEFSFRRLTRVLPAAGLPAFVQMSTLGWLGLLLARAWGWNDVESVFLGACLAVSSTMVVVRAIDEVEVPKPAAELALGILVSQDLVAILLIAGLTAVVSGVGLDAGALAATAGELALFLAGLVVVGLLVIPRLVRRLLRMGHPEMLVVAVTGTCFGLALLAERMGYSVALGAFIAGSLVAEAGKTETVERLVRPIRDLFAAVFFVAVGMAVDPRQLAEHLPLGLAAVATIVLGQLVSVTVGGTLGGRGLATSVRAGAALGQIGEFSFIIATLGVASGAVRPDLYSAVVIAALVTTFTTSLVLRFADRIAVGIDGVLPRRVQTMLSLYGSWLGRLSVGVRETVRRSRTRRLLAALALDTAVLVALTLVAVLAHQPLASSLAHAVGLPEPWSVGLVLAATLLLALPFVAGVLRCGRSLGRMLAEEALPPRAGLDLADAPRNALRVLLEVAVVLAVTLVFVAATQPFLPVGWGMVALAIAAVGLGLALWRTSGDLQEHVQAGAQVFAESLLRSPSSAPGGHEAELGELLPGLGDLTAVGIGEGAHAAGRTLAELNLRGHTGATVLAVRRGETVHQLPGGDWRLEPGDLLGLTGSRESVVEARQLLHSSGAAKE